MDFIVSTNFTKDTVLNVQLPLFENERLYVNKVSPYGTTRKKSKEILYWNLLIFLD